MDEALIETYRRLSEREHCSVDDILECPVLRSMFLAAVREVLGDAAEREVLHRLSRLRKDKRLPRSRALLAGQ